SRRRLFWLVFFGTAAVIALVPELYFPEPGEEGDMPVVVRSIEQQGELAALRTLATKSVSATPSEVASAAPAAPADLFAPHSWYVATPAQPVVVRPGAAPVAPQPVAPPLPFSFIGKLDDSQRLQIFLLNGERLHVVTVGDVIDGTYRVERIDPQQLTLTYLPM